MKKIIIKSYLWPFGPLHSPGQRHVCTSFSLSMQKTSTLTFGLLDLCIRPGQRHFCTSCSLSMQKTSTLTFGLLDLCIRPDRDMSLQVFPCLCKNINTYLWPFWTSAFARTETFLYKFLPVYAKNINTYLWPFGPLHSPGQRHVSTSFSLSMQKHQHLPLTSHLRPLYPGGQRHVWKSFSWDGLQ